MKSPRIGLLQASWILRSASSLGCAAVFSQPLLLLEWFHGSLQIAVKWRHCSNLFVLSNPAWEVGGALSQKLSPRSHCISLPLVWPFTYLWPNHSALEECADVLRPGSPCGVTRGVGEGGRSAPGATGSRDECTGAPQTAVTGSRVYVHYSWLQKESVMDWFGIKGQDLN